MNSLPMSATWFVFYSSSCSSALVSLLVITMQVWLIVMWLQWRSHRSFFVSTSCCYWSLISYIRFGLIVFFWSRIRRFFILRRRLFISILRSCLLLLSLLWIAGLFLMISIFLIRWSLRCFLRCFPTSIVLSRGLSWLLLLLRWLFFSSFTLLLLFHF